MADLSSLIPKTYPQQEVRAKRGVGILMFLGIIFFILAFVILAGVFFYKNLLVRQVAGLNNSLKRLEADFEPPLIQELARTSKTLAAGKELLSSHSSVSRLFKFLEDNTVELVRFSNFIFSAKDLKLIVMGEAKSYTLLAQQASIFEHSPLVKKLSLSNLSLRENGNINFTAEIILDPSSISSR
ncbi:MAG: hypothetical protein Q8R12_02625 [bacterium]|nr:hypothetical protein [bacterium]